MPATKHARHLQQQGQGKNGRNPEHPHLSLVSGKPAFFFLDTGCFADFICAIARLDNSSDEIFDCFKSRVKADVSSFRGKIDGRSDARKLIKSFFDAAAASSASHSANLKLYRLGGYVKPRLFYRADEVFGPCLGRVEFHASFFAGEVDCCMNAGELIEILLDTRSACRTGHPFYWEFHLLKRQ